MSLVGSGPYVATPESHDKWAWPSDYLQTSCTTPALTPGSGSEAGWPALEHGGNLFEAMM